MFNLDVIDRVKVATNVDRKQDDKGFKTLDKLVDELQKKTDQNGGQDCSGSDYCRGIFD